MPYKQQEIIGLMREVLGDAYTHFDVSSVTIKENVKEQTTAITCEVVVESSGETLVIAGEGVGVIDALFAGVVSRFASEYSSLQTLRFHSFSVTAQLETKHGFSGSDSATEVKIEIANSEGKLFTFKGSSRSVTSSAIVTTLAGLEYFINSERAFVTIYHALKDARERNRSDLVSRYTDIMASLVQNTSYSEVLSRIRDDLG